MPCESANQLLKAAYKKNEERGSWPTNQLYIRRCEALVAAYEGDFERANPIFQEVIDGYGCMEARLYQTLVLREWGQVLSESENLDNKRQACPILEEALAGYKAMGATLNAAWVDERLKTLGH